MWGITVIPVERGSKSCRRFHLLCCILIQFNFISNLNHFFTISYIWQRIVYFCHPVGLIHYAHNRSSPVPTCLFVMQTGISSDVVSKGHLSITRGMVVLSDGQPSLLLYNVNIHMYKGFVYRLPDITSCLVCLCYGRNIHYVRCDFKMWCWKTKCK